MYYRTFMVDKVSGRNKIRDINGKVKWSFYTKSATIIVTFLLLYGVGSAVGI